MKTILIFSDFDGTATSIAGGDICVGKDTLQEQFYQTLFTNHQEGVIQDYCATTMLTTDQLQKKFVDKFGEYSDNKAFEKDESVILLSLDAVEFFHETLKKDNVKVHIISKNREEYITAVLKYQGFSKDELDRISLHAIKKGMTSMDKRRVVYDVMKGKQVDGVHAIVLDDSRGDCNAMVDILDVYNVTHITKHNRRPKTFKWQTYLKTVKQLSQVSAKIEASDNKEKNDSSVNLRKVVLLVIQDYMYYLKDKIAQGFKEHGMSFLFTSDFHSKLITAEDYNAEFLNYALNEKGVMKKVRAFISDEKSSFEPNSLNVHIVNALAKHKIITTQKDYTISAVIYELDYMIESMVDPIVKSKIETTCVKKSEVPKFFKETTRLKLHKQFYTDLFAHLDSSCITHLKTKNIVCKTIYESMDEAETFAKKLKTILPDCATVKARRSSRFIKDGSKQGFSVAIKNPEEICKQVAMDSLNELNETFPIKDKDSKMNWEYEATSGLLYITFKPMENTQPNEETKICEDALSRYKTAYPASITFKEDDKKCIYKECTFLDTNFNLYLAAKNSLQPDLNTTVSTELSNEACNGHLNKNKNFFAPTKETVTTKEKLNEDKAHTL